MVGKASGQAGIAYWLNDYFELDADCSVQKQDPLVLGLKTWIAREYEDGRQTSITADELLEQVQRLAPGRFETGAC